MGRIKSYRKYLKNIWYIYIYNFIEGKLFYNFYLITLKFKIDNIIADNYNDNLVGK